MSLCVYMFLSNYVLVILLLVISVKSLRLVFIVSYNPRINKVSYLILSYLILPVGANNLTSYKVSVCSLIPLTALAAHLLGIWGVINWDTLFMNVQVSGRAQTSD